MIINFTKLAGHHSSGGPRRPFYGYHSVVSPRHTFNGGPDENILTPVSISKTIWKPVSKKHFTDMILRGKVLWEISTGTEKALIIEVTFAFIQTKTTSAATTNAKKFQ